MLTPGAPTEADRQRYRAVMGHFTTGVAVVTAQSADGAFGMTTNALCSLSLDPLLLLVCFDNEARTLPVVRQARRFAVNVLSAGQSGLAGQFASKIPVERKFEDIEHSLERRRPGPRGRARVARVRPARAASRRRPHDRNRRGRTRWATARASR